MNSMFLLGAGASIDGGLADAFSLTRKIYDHLINTNKRDAAKIFGLVVSKIISRKVRDGGSPFEKINVEEVYDGLRRLSSRQSDLLSDFVTAWDPSINLLRMPVREHDVHEALQSFVDSLQPDQWSTRGRLKVGAGGSRKIVKILDKLSNPSTDMSDVERFLLEALVHALQHDDQKTVYFERIMEIVKENSGDICTLNYDLIAESVSRNLGFTYDYGLDKWNREKIVEFRRSSVRNIRILKLHGSLNWFAKGDDIEVREERDRIWVLPNLVFGGSSGKLRADGPFLQLRHEFQVRLLNCNILVVIGYSFQDEHLNSIIRRWTNTRRNAKLIIVNPDNTGEFAQYIGTPYLNGNHESRKLTVDLKHIKRGAANSVDLLSDLLRAPIQTHRENRNGLLPHVHFDVYE